MSSIIHCDGCGKELDVGDTIDEHERRTVDWVFRYERDPSTGSKFRKDFCGLVCAGPGEAKLWKAFCAELRVLENSPLAREVQGLQDRTRFQNRVPYSQWTHEHGCCTAKCTQFIDAEEAGPEQRPWCAILQRKAKPGGLCSVFAIGEALRML